MAYPFFLSPTAKATFLYDSNLLCPVKQPEEGAVSLERGSEGEKKKGRGRWKTAVDEEQKQRKKMYFSYYERVGRWQENI